MTYYDDTETYLRYAKSLERGAEIAETLLREEGLNAVALADGGESVSTAALELLVEQRDRARRIAVEFEGRIELARQELHVHFPAGKDPLPPVVDMIRRVQAALDGREQPDA